MDDRDSAHVLLLHVYLRQLCHDVAQLSVDLHQLVRCGLRALPACVQLRLRSCEAVLRTPYPKLGLAATRLEVRVREERIRTEERRAELEVRLACERDHFLAPRRDIPNKLLNGASAPGRDNRAQLASELQGDPISTLQVN